MKYAAVVGDRVRIVPGRYARPSEITVQLGRYEAAATVDLSPGEALEFAAHLVLAAKEAEETRPETALRDELEQLQSSNARLEDLLVECQRQLRGALGNVDNLQAKLHDLKERSTGRPDDAGEAG